MTVRLSLYEIIRASSSYQQIRALQQAIEFSLAMEAIQSMAGHSQEEYDAISKDILALAKEEGKQPNGQDTSESR